MDNFFYGEEKKERKSRWGDKAVKKSKFFRIIIKIIIEIHKDVVLK